MAQPTPYSLGYSFQGWQILNPNRPLPADKIEGEYNDIALTLSQTLANLALIQRDDGFLANASVGFDQLKPELSGGIPQPTAWATNTPYLKGDTVFNITSLYRNLVAHTSGTFATDLAAGNWLLLASLSVVGLAAIAASGSASDLIAGTVPAARMPALTGDVTTSAGAVASTIAAGAVSLAKMANLAANSFIGNNTGSPATPLALTAAQAKTLLAIANTDVSGLGTLSTQSGTFSGTHSGTSSGTNTGDQTITLTSDVTGTGAGSFATTIAAGVVTLAKLANLAANSIIGNNTGAPATPLALTAAQVKTLLAIASGDVSGLGALATITPGANVATNLANAATGSGAPVFGTAPTFTTSLTSPLVIGGTGAASTLVLESTSGAGTTDSIQFLTGSQAEVFRLDTSGANFYKTTANAVNTSATLTVAQIQGRIITSTTAAGVTMTMPTGTVLDTAGTGLAATALPNKATIDFTVKNLGGTNAITMAVASGVTNGGAAGDLTIAANATATFRLQKTATNTFVLYKM